MYLLVVLLFATFVRGDVTEREYEMKPPIFHMDGFDRCMAYGDEALYCTTFVKLTHLNSTKSPEWKTIEKLIRQPNNYRHDLLRHYVCVPKTCPDIPQSLYAIGNGSEALRKAIGDCYTHMYREMSLKGEVVHLHCEGDHSIYEIDKFDMVALVLFVVLLTLIILATKRESELRSAKPHEDQIKSSEFLSCFAVQKHWDGLMRTSDNVEVPCIQGLRVLSTTMVICGHTYMASIGGPIENTRNNEGVTKTWYLMLLSNGAMLVHTNFLLAGWMLSMGVFKHVDRVKEHASPGFFLKVYIKRVVRLTPVMLVGIIIHGTWLRHLSRGPNWDRVIGSDAKNCRHHWWANVLYIHNYYDPTAMCLPHTWYLAVDTQLFGVSLIVMYFAVKYRKYAMHILSLSTIAGFIIPFLVHYINELDITLRAYPEATFNFMLLEKQWQKLSISSESDIGSYMQGLLFGYIYYKYKNTSVKLNNTVMHLLWYIFVIGVPFTIIHMVYFFYNGYQHTRLEGALYHTLSRNLLVAAVGVYVLGVSSGYGGILKKWLEFKPFQILGKLSYSIYIFHGLHMRIMVGKQRQPANMHFEVMLNRAAGDILLSYLEGLAAYLIFEGPISELSKLLLEPKPVKNNVPKVQLENSVEEKKKSN